MSTEAAVLDRPMDLVSGALWRRRILALMLMLSIAGIFWVDSRYPALLKKSRSGTHVKVSGALTFDVLYPVDPSMPLASRVWRTSVNWLNANRIGMTFAFLFGPAALAFLATLGRRRAHSRYLNTLFGTFAGIPLAVCANCVAPIGRGLYLAGMSTESVMAAMFASPTLNVVVLVMTFALFPLPVALLKLATVLILIFGLAPLMASREVQRGIPACPVPIPAGETFAASLAATLGSYAKSFWTIFRAAFPLMLVAAVLGAAAIELFPASALYPATVSFGGILLVALIGSFLPVPMAFDVVIAYIAMSRGVPLPYVVTILCTLGVYSVYSLSVVGKTISWKVATAAFAAVMFLGVLAGNLARAL